jgi:hypothetical protein
MSLPVRTRYAPALLLLAACSAHDPGVTSLALHEDAGAPARGNAAPTVDDLAVVESIANDGYVTSSAFVKASTTYASTAAAGSSITLWVSAQSLSAFDAISPDVSGSHATVPPGTLIVRAVQNTAGSVQKLTLMCKGPPGYNPELGDWWFGVTSPDGAPARSAAGVIQLGKLTACYSCHQKRGDDDFLFGIPASARTAHP